jgi:hypothetical protein
LGNTALGSSKVYLKLARLRLTGNATANAQINADIQKQRKSLKIYTPTMQRAEQCRLAEIRQQAREKHLIVF